MACKVCDEAYGLNLCKNECEYHICSECAGKFSKCPQCNTVLRINIFFAGKIIKVGKPCGKTCRIVAHGKTGAWEVVNDEGGQVDLKAGDIILYDDYLKTSTVKIEPLQIAPTTNLTGPFVILTNDLNIMHGDWEQQDHYEDIKSISKIVNLRNMQAIEQCDVFTLSINNSNDCFKSFSEWGMDKVLKKILILIVEDNNYDIGEFYLFASESLESLEHVSFLRREAIFKSHPMLSMGYDEYKKLMENIHSQKRFDDVLALCDRNECEYEYMLHKNESEYEYEHELSLPTGTCLL